MFSMSAFILLKMLWIVSYYIDNCDTPADDILYMCRYLTATECVPRADQRCYFITNVMIYDQEHLEA